MQLLLHGDKLTPKCSLLHPNLRLQAGLVWVWITSTLDAAKAKDVIDHNSPSSDYHCHSRMTLELMLLPSSTIFARADGGMKEGNSLDFAELIYRKTLGVIISAGYGLTISRTAKAFGMQIIAYDPVLTSDEIGKRGGKPVSLDDLLTMSDFITLHIPLTPESMGIINTAAFEKMKPGVRIICAARGGVINEPALLSALQSGKVAGAALDVFTTEPPGKTELASHPKVVCTPHIGAETSEAQVRAAIDISTEVIAALEGKPLRWRIV